MNFEDWKAEALRLADDLLDARVTLGQSSKEGEYFRELEAVNRARAALSAHLDLMRPITFDELRKTAQYQQAAERELLAHFVKPEAKP